MILVDTSVWIDFLDGTDNRQTDHLSTSLDSEIPIFYTGIILQEILQGFHNKKQQAFIKAEFRKLLSVTPSIDDHIKRGRDIHYMSKKRISYQKINRLSHICPIKSLQSIAIRLRQRLCLRRKMLSTDQNPQSPS